jgi:hypothetical protein
VDEVFTSCGVEDQAIAECVYIVEEAVLQQAIRIVPVPAFRPEGERDSSKLQPMDQRPGNPVLHVKKQYYRRRPQITDQSAILQEIEWQLLKTKLNGFLIVSAKPIRND